MNNNKKCSSKNHKEFNAISYCQECNIYMCNKCTNIHLDLCQNHHSYNLNIDIQEIFTGICQEKNHLNTLEYFCKTHNALCCAVCITKIKRKGNGQHTDCNVCNIEDIKEEKKNKFDKNIKYLEELLNIINPSIDELKKIYEKINKNKDNLKLDIQKIFTQIRNVINEREDEILLEVDKKYDELFFKEEFIKESEKLPSKVKFNLEKGKKITNEWNNDNKLNSLINVCINIENNIQYIDEINKKIKKYNSNNISIKFCPKFQENKTLKNISINNKNIEKELNFIDFGNLKEENLNFDKNEEKRNIEFDLNFDIKNENNDFNFENENNNEINIDFNADNNIENNNDVFNFDEEKNKVIEENDRDIDINKEEKNKQENEHKNDNEINYFLDFLNELKKFGYLDCDINIIESK